MKARTLLIAGIIGLLTLPLLAETILIFQPGERKNVWLEVRERDGSNFTLDTAVYWIIDEAGMSEQTAAATIQGSRIYSSVDAATWTSGSEYRLWVRWGVAETDEIYINIVQIDCGEEIE